MTIKVILRGGGDLASGAAIRMARSGMQVFISELAQPYAVRRTVSYAEAVYTGSTHVEETLAVLAENFGQAREMAQRGVLPVLIDPNLEKLVALSADVIVDGRMTKAPETYNLSERPFIIGLGPGFQCGVNCHAAVETRRGPNLGRVIWEGTTEADTGLPEVVLGRREDRVIRAAKEGIFRPLAEIGESVVTGQAIGEVNGEIIRAHFDGMIRGLIHGGLPVAPGLKIGDLDPRMDPTLVQKVSDKALSVGGGVVEAILSRQELRQRYCEE